MGEDERAVRAGGPLVVISGPSGCGKSTICRALARDPDVWLSVSATTRRPRADEVEGRDYLFLTRQAFESGLAASRFLEHAEVFGDLYGTPREPLEEALSAGRRALLDIDVQGAMQVKRACPEAILVFIEPPSTDILAERLEGRGTEPPEVVHRRLAAAEREMAYRDQYDHVVVNDDLDTAVGRVRGILDRADAPARRHDGAERGN